MSLFKKKSAEPKDQRQKQYESAQLALRKDFWLCGICGQEFRISKDSPPICCPKCGRTRASSLGEVANEELWAEETTCPKYKETVEMLNGERARVCPCCGWEIH